MLLLSEDISLQPKRHLIKGFTLAATISQNMLTILRHFRNNNQNIHIFYFTENLQINANLLQIQQRNVTINNYTQLHVAYNASVLAGFFLKF